MTGNVAFGAVRCRGGRWQLRWRVAGRETSSSHATREEAVAESWRLHALGARGRHALHLGATMPVWEVARLWMRSSGHARSTLETEFSHLRNHIGPTFGQVPLGDVSRVAVERWASDLRLAPTTSQRVVRVLAALCQFGLKRGWIDSDPTAGVWISGANRRRRLQLPTIEELEVLRSVLDPRFRVALDLGAFVGCTIGEAAAMRVDDLDFGRRTVHVRRLRRRDHAGRVVLDEQMKTPTRDRTVPVVPEHVWNRWADLQNLGAGSLLVTAPSGGVLHPGNYRQRIWQPAVRQVFGDAHALVPHDLRHFAISLWLAATVTSRDAADWAGHSSPTLVEGTYSHSLPRTGSVLEGEVLTSVLAGRSHPRLRLLGGAAA